MTNYYVRSTSVLLDLIKAAKSANQKDLDTIQQWVDGLIALAGTVEQQNGIYALIQEVKTEREKLSGIRSLRLGLRAAQINPRGPYGFATAWQGDYLSSVNNLTNRVKEVLAYINNCKLLEELYDAIDLVIKAYYADLGSPKPPSPLPVALHLAKSFRDDLLRHRAIVCGKTLTPEEKKRLEFLTDPIEPMLGSSYWPSSFIASSSSSSTLPPAPSSSSPPVIRGTMGLRGRTS